MASWDVFHADSLELERGLTSDAIRAAMAGGALRDDDLVRPAGTTAAWARLGDFPELLPAPATSPALGLTGPPAVVPGGTERRREPTAKGPGASDQGRGGRVESPAAKGEPSDFEVRADHLGPIEQSGPPPAATTTAAPPAWIELGGEPDDVTFPVMPDREDEQWAEVASSGPAKAEPPRGPQWAWPDDDDDDAEDGAIDEGRAEAGDCDDELEILDDEAAGLEILDDDALAVPSPMSREATAGNGASHVSLPVVPSRDWNEDRHPVEGGEEDEDFTFTRSGPMTVEELDLAPMVDVAFQLVLFFMVTATTVLYKTLEIPKPTQDQAPGAVAQGQSRSVDDLQKDYVLVEIDSAGAMKIDREPVTADVDALAERLRTAREKTGRKIMLLSADYGTAHRNAVLAYDAAIEIGMGIAIAKPTTPQGPAPSVFPGAKRGGGTASPAAPGSSPPPTPSRSSQPAPSSAPPAGGVPF